MTGLRPNPEPPATPALAGTVRLATIHVGVELVCLLRDVGGLRPCPTRFGCLLLGDGRFTLRPRRALIRPGLLAFGFEQSVPSQVSMLASLDAAAFEPMLLAATDRDHGDDDHDQNDCSYNDCCHLDLQLSFGSCQIDHLFTEGPLRERAGRPLLRDVPPRDTHAMDETELLERAAEYHA